MSEKVKLSVWLTDKGFYPTRSQATNAIKDGKVRVNNRVITKAGYEVRETDLVEIEKEEIEYVSRGGYKLEAALRTFGISLENKVILDIGASTGGFTDCCLKNGARRVYAYDVGHDQLAEKLRNDPRVISKEGINARYLHKEDLPERIDFICMDVSFISCTRIMGSIADILPENGECVLLFKPQFEVGREHINNKGIVTDLNAVNASMEEAIRFAESMKLHYVNKIASPVKGQDGNQEYLLYFTKE